MALHDPMRRTERLIEESAGDDVVIYDRDSDRVTALDAADAKVWRNSDGTKSVADLALLAELSESEAAAALVRLDEAGLMAETGMSRRSMLQKAGLVGAGVGAMSLVSIVAPVAAHAASITPPGGAGTVAVGTKNPVISLGGTAISINPKTGVLVVPPIVGTGFPGNTDVTVTIAVTTPTGATKTVPVIAHTTDDGDLYVDSVHVLNATLGSKVSIVANTAGGIVTPTLTNIIGNVNRALGNIGTNLGKITG